MSDFVPIYKPRFVIEEQGDLLRITTSIPQREKIVAYFAIAFLSLLAIGFLFSPIFVFIVNSYDKITAILSLFSTGLYAILLFVGLGYVIILGIRRTLKQIIEVTDKSIVILEGDYNFYRPKKYAAACVKNLRGSTYPGKKEGAVKFDYGSQTIVFGKSLEEAEANLIVQTIIEKFPNLREPRG